jgi:hypothetical protein
MLKQEPASRGVGILGLQAGEEVKRRTGFKPRAPHREQRDPDRVRSVPTVSDGAWRTPRAVDAMPAAQVRKAAPVR